MSTAKPPKMVARTQNTELPFDVIIAHILPRLPVKSLLKFKCVCREWYSTITCREFAKSYLRHPFSLSSTSVLTLTFTLVGPIGNIFEVVDYTDPNNLVRTQFEIKSKHPFIWLSSSCNGLVFLISSPLDPVNFDLPDHLRHFNFEYVVFNPAVDVNSLAEIPHPPQFSFQNDSYNFGFGYVESPDDYYIVAMNVINSKVVVYVYSLKSQQWQSPRNFNILMQFQESWYDDIGTLVNETLHWGVTQSENRKRIAAYNLNNLDDIDFMDLPYAKFGSGRENFPDFSLGCIEGCLCAWARYGDGGEVAEMWMLKDYYGGPDNWTKLFRLRMTMDDYPCCFYGFTASKMGLILSANIHEILLTDFSRDPPEYENTGIEDKQQVVNYVQSLESITFSIQRK